MNSNRKILHIDMDAFFASVEQLDNPSLAGKPVIVGGNPQSRGVVAACSYEARRFGIHSAMACAKAVKRCPQAVFVRPRMQRYKEISQQVMAVFHRFTDLVEPLSLDEAFLDITVNKVNEPSATRLAEEIRAQIFNTTQLTASAGVSFNKFLAKVASDLNKPNGISVITPSEALKFLADLPIGKFFGVGKVTEKKMQRIGVATGADLKRFSRDELTFHFGKNGTFFFDIVRGIDQRPVKNTRERKSIGSETTLSTDTMDMDEIFSILHSLSDSVGSSLLKRDCGGFTVTLKVRYHDFTTITRSFTGKIPFFCSEDIRFNLPRLLQATEAGRRKIRLLGISVSNLTGEKKFPRQLRLPFM